MKGSHVRLTKLMGITAHKESTGEGAYYAISAGKSLKPRHLKDTIFCYEWLLAWCLKQGSPVKYAPHKAWKHHYSCDRDGPLSPDKASESHHTYCANCRYNFECSQLDVTLVGQVSRMQSVLHRGLYVSVPDTCLTMRAIPQGCALKE